MANYSWTTDEEQKELAKKKFEEKERIKASIKEKSIVGENKSLPTKENKPQKAEVKNVPKLKVGRPKKK